MEKYLNLPCAKIAFIIIFLLIGAGCAGEYAYVTPDNKPLTGNTVAEEENTAPGKTEGIATLFPPESLEKPHPTPKPGPREKTDQQRLDSALEFCQASNDFWEQGDLDNAIDALDQAYSLILKISPDQIPEILRQRDDLRVTISKRIIEVYSSRFTVANGIHKVIPLEMN
ncbi:MAG: hypothetical protein JRD02_13105, partial [Deltaproteobacteria bacterium]|nr:hypothetical protein [Deltaproteobacteria bacterium]